MRSPVRFCLGLIFDNADEVTQVQVAVGTTDAANERTLTYSNNGQLATLKDGENKLTTYEYDGFARLSKTRYPLPAKGSNASSTTDYEQLGYDANSNITSRRLRDATSILFTFDNLDRMTLNDPPRLQKSFKASGGVTGRRRRRRRCLRSSSKRKLT